MIKFKLSKDLCPKCKKIFLYEERALNSLSRNSKMGEAYVCNDCGEKESLELLKSMEKQHD